MPLSEEKMREILADGRRETHQEIVKLLESKDADLRERVDKIHDWLFTENGHKSASRRIDDLESGIGRLTEKGSQIVLWILMVVMGVKEWPF